MWTRAFSIVKMLPREVPIFPEKSKISNFSFEILQINAKYKDMLK